MSDLARLDQKVDKISENVTRITTTLDLFFDPETGHFHEMKKKVAEHDDFVKKATWTFRLAALVGASGVIAALKAKFGIGNN
jgi:hypothetical protein